MGILLTQNKIAIIDDEDYEKVKNYKWYAQKIDNGYRAQAYIKGVGRKGKNKVRMHRLIMDAPDNRQVDHINGNMLDNRKFNLRLCNHKQNCANRNLYNTNTSGYKGVTWDKRLKQWRAKLTYNYRTIHLGGYDNILKAAKAYDKGAEKYFKNFAKLNF